MRVLLTLLLLAAPSFASDSVFPSKETKRAARQLDPLVLSDENRVFLKGKMKVHSKDMRGLSIAVATLEMADVQKAAQGVASAPRLDRAMGPASKLPPRFFDLQDSLKKVAQELADAGKANDPTEVVEKYQQLITICVSCHAGFKAGAPQAP